MNNAIISAFIQSGPFGKTILLSLLFLSIYIWTIIQSKYFLLKKINDKTKIFLNEYNKSSENIFEPLKNENFFKDIPAYILYINTKNELLRIMDEERSIDIMDIDAIGNILYRLISETKLKIDKGINSLATVATIAPFLGLLGTVWGLMNAFIGMGEMGNASISAVAPGLSEALVTTAVGLLVAIPSAVAFNYAKVKLQEEISILNNFALTILANIERKFVSRDKKT